MKRWCIVLAALLLTAAGALADGGDSSGLDGMQAQDIYRHYPQTLIEDYSEMTLNGRLYAFVLFRHEEKQALQISYLYEYSYGEKRWVDWFTTEDAVPQSERAQLETDGQNLTISATDGNGGQKAVTYTWFADVPNEPIGDPLYKDWLNGGFRLTAYDGVRVEQNGTLHFADGDAAVNLLTDMRYVCYENLPQTAQAARETDAVPPGFCVYIPEWHTPPARVMQLSPNHSRKVYLGPGNDYPRAGNGKAAVGTNGWVQVFGRYKGWLMIQYHIDGNHYRIGWIDDNALPAGTAVETLQIDDYWPNNKPEEEITTDCVLTDDPMGSGAVIAHLKAGQKVNHRAYFCADWELITVKIDGKYYWGFVPNNCLTHG